MHPIFSARTAKFFPMAPGIIAALLLSAGCASHSAARAGATGNEVEKLKPIFDGKTLAGWEHHGGGRFTAENGEIVGKNFPGSKHGWLCTTKTYGDFILELEVKIKTGNSGVQIRSHVQTNDFMVGYQIEVDPSPRSWSGGLYDQGRRKWLQDLKNNEAAQKAFKAGEWNTFRIECVGDWIRSWVNGVPATDFHDSMDAGGVIALQAHANRNVEVWFRNIRLQELNRTAAKAP